MSEEFPGWLQLAMTEFGGAYGRRMMVKSSENLKAYNAAAVALEAAIRRYAECLRDGRREPGSVV